MRMPEAGAEVKQIGEAGERDPDHHVAHQASGRGAESLPGARRREGVAPKGSRRRRTRRGAACRTGTDAGEGDEGGICQSVTATASRAASPSRGSASGVSGPRTPTRRTLRSSKVLPEVRREFASDLPVANHEVRFVPDVRVPAGKPDHRQVRLVNRFPPRFPAGAHHLDRQHPEAVRRLWKVLVTAAVLLAPVAARALVGAVFEISKGVRPRGRSRGRGGRARGKAVDRRPGPGVAPLRPLLLPPQAASLVAGPVVDDHNEECCRAHDEGFSAALRRDGSAPWRPPRRPLPRFPRRPLRRPAAPHAAPPAANRPSRSSPFSRSAIRSSGSSRPMWKRTTGPEKGRNEAVRSRSGWTRSARLS